MNKEEAKAIIAVIAEEQEKNGNNCCNFRGGCTALNDSEYIKNSVDEICGTIACPFFKTNEDQIRIGDKLFTEEEYRAYRNTKITVKWVNKRLSALDDYALNMVINLDNAPYDRGVRAGITYAVDYITRELKKVRPAK